MILPPVINQVVINNGDKSEYSSGRNKSQSYNKQVERNLEPMVNASGLNPLQESGAACPLVFRTNSRGASNYK
jgi:hypothetical protein